MSYKRVFITFFVVGFIGYWFIPKDYNPNVNVVDTTIATHTSVASPSGQEDSVYDGNCTRTQQNNNTKVVCK